MYAAADALRRHARTHDQQRARPHPHAANPPHPYPHPFAHPFAPPGAPPLYMQGERFPPVRYYSPAAAAAAVAAAASAAPETAAAPAAPAAPARVPRRPSASSYSVPAPPSTAGRVLAARLRSPVLARGAFAADVDAPYLAHRGFATVLATDMASALAAEPALGGPGDGPRTRAQWRAVRRRMCQVFPAGCARPRRFSESFLAAERTELAVYRADARAVLRAAPLDEAADAHTGAPLGRLWWQRYPFELPHAPARGAPIFLRVRRSPCADPRPPNPPPDPDLWRYPPPAMHEYSCFPPDTNSDHAHFLPPPQRFPVLPPAAAPPRWLKRKRAGPIFRHLPAGASPSPPPLKRPRVSPPRRRAAPVPALDVIYVPGKFLSIAPNGKVTVHVNDDVLTVPDLDVMSVDPPRLPNPQGPVDLPKSGTPGSVVATASPVAQLSEAVVAHLQATAAAVSGHMARGPPRAPQGRVSGSGNGAGTVATSSVPRASPARRPAASAAGPSALLLPPQTPQALTPSPRKAVSFKSRTGTNVEYEVHVRAVAEALRLLDSKDTLLTALQRFNDHAERAVTAAKERCKSTGIPSPARHQPSPVSGHGSGSAFDALQAGGVAVAPGAAVATSNTENGGTSQAALMNLAGSGVGNGAAVESGDAGTSEDKAIPQTVRVSHAATLEALARVNARLDVVLPGMRGAMYDTGRDSVVASTVVDHSAALAAATAAVGAAPLTSRVALFGGGVLDFDATSPLSRRQVDKASGLSLADQLLRSHQLRLGLPPECSGMNGARASPPTLFSGSSPPGRLPVVIRESSMPRSAGGGSGGVSGGGDGGGDGGGCSPWRTPVTGGARGGATGPVDTTNASSAGIGVRSRLQLKRGRDATERVLRPEHMAKNVDFWTSAGAALLAKALARQALARLPEADMLKSAPASLRADVIESVSACVALMMRARASRSSDAIEDLVDALRVRCPENEDVLTLIKTSVRELEGTSSDSQGG